jgi:hypothetical protein
MKIDIRGRRLLDNDLLLPEEQRGLLRANDHEDLDDDEETMDAWIPNGRVVRERREKRQQHSIDSDIDDDFPGDREDDSEDDSDGDTGDNGIQADIAECIDQETDESRKLMMREASEQRSRLIAGDIADLKSKKLSGFLSTNADSSLADAENDSQLPKRGNSTLLSKGAGSRKGATRDFSFTDADL